jgi:hypothetical protein
MPGSDRASVFCRDDKLNSLTLSSHIEKRRNWPKTSRDGNVSILTMSSRQK